jgi:flagellar biosynthesis anti-sigma factor FlgM
MGHRSKEHPALEISESAAARARHLNDTAATVQPRRQPPAPAAPPDAGPEDSIEVSPEARTLAAVDELARARRVHELRAQVDAGTYTVDPAEVAHRMAERGEA